MKEQPNLPLLIVLAILIVGILIAVGGFDDADVRDLENPQTLSLLK
jgi:hypothetical protein